MQIVDEDNRILYCPYCGGTHFKDKSKIGSPLLSGLGYSTLGHIGLFIGFLGAKERYQCKSCGLTLM